MYRAARVVQDVCDEARMGFEDLIEPLLSPVATELTHRQAADHIERQGWLESRGVGDVGPVCAGQDGVPRLQRRLHRRRLESLFGTVPVEQLGDGPAGQESLPPLDAELNLPNELSSHVLRKKVVVEAARSRRASACGPALKKAPAVTLLQVVMVLAAVLPLREFDP